MPPMLGRVGQVVGIEAAPVVGHIEGVVGVVTVQAQNSAPATRTPVVADAADAADADLTQSTHLSIADATKAAQTALDAAAEENQRVSVAVGAPSGDLDEKFAQAGVAAIGK